MFQEWNVMISDIVLSWY